MADLRRDEPLFDRFLPIHVHAGGITENRPTNLVFRILKGQQQTQAIGQNECVYHFEVTDDRDPYFIYFFEVGEGDFPQFKRDQSILVEFHAVPLKLIELLDQCLRSANMLESDARDDAEQSHHQQQRVGVSLLNQTSTYTAELDTTTGIFSIIEANQFNKLVHLKIPLQLGDDAAIKLYLASRLGLALSVARRQQHDIFAFERRCADNEAMMDDMKQELSELRTQKNVDLQSLRAQHSQELNTLQRQNLEAAEDTRIRTEEAMNQLKRLLEETQKELHTRTMQSQQTIADLEHQRSQLDFKNRDLARVLLGTEQDRDRLFKECEELHGRRRELEEERAGLLRDITRLESKVEGIQSTLHERDESMAKSLQLQRASEEAKAGVEERLRMYMTKCDETQRHLEETQEEVERYQTLSAKLQTECKGLKDRFKDKNDVLRKQEAVIVDLRGRIGELERQLSVTQDDVKKAGHANDKLRLELKETEDKLAQALGSVEEQRNVVSYLTEEINRIQLGQRIVAEPHLHTSSSSMLKSVSVVTPTSSGPSHHMHRSSSAPSGSSAYAAYTPTTGSSSTSAAMPAGATATANAKTPDTAVYKFSSGLPSTSSAGSGGLMSGGAGQGSNTALWRSTPLHTSDTASRPTTTFTGTGSSQSHLNNSTSSSSYKLKGLQNLGLAAALESDFALQQALADLQQADANPNPSSSSSSEENSAVARRPLYTAARRTLRPEDVDLGRVDYYALDKPLASSAASGAGSSGSGKRSGLTAASTAAMTAGTAR